MKAFHGMESTKQMYLQRLKEHRINDDFRRGFYWSNGKGCGIGCTIHETNYVHEQYSMLLGIPLDLVYLKDILYETLPIPDFKMFPEIFLGAIEPGADLSLVSHALVIWLLTDSEYGLRKLASETSKRTIDTLVNLIKRQMNNEHIKRSAWRVYDFSSQIGPWPVEDKNADWYVDCSILGFINYYEESEPDIMSAVVFVLQAQSRANNSVDGAYAKIMADKLIELLKEVR